MSVSVQKTYLGDGVYADISELGIVLTTENGVDTSNTIVLESEVWFALVRWVEKIRGRP